MPITLLADLFDGVAHEATGQVIADEPHWLWAQTCEVWHESDETKRARLLLVYRSPLVDFDDPEFQPIQQMILDAGEVNTLVTGVTKDPEFMHGEAHWALYRLAAADHECELFQCEHIMDQLVSLVANLYLAKEQV